MGCDAGSFALVDSIKRAKIRDGAIFAQTSHQLSTHCQQVSPLPTQNPDRQTHCRMIQSPLLYQAACSLCHSFSASFMRFCQPWPVARKAPSPAGRFRVANRHIRATPMTVCRSMVDCLAANTPYSFRRLSPAGIWGVGLRRCEMEEGSLRGRLGK